MELTGALAANGAISKSEKGGSVSLSMAANIVVHDTRAFIQDSSIIDVSNVNISASNLSVTAAVAGSLAYSAGDAGIGPSLALNVVTEGNRAYILDSSIVSRGNIDVSAWNLGVTGSLAVAGGITKGGAAVPISLSNNTVVNITQSYIAATDPAASHLIQAAGDIRLTATDTSVITGNAGSLGIGLRKEGGESDDDKSKAGGAFGGAISVNTVVGLVESYVQGAVLMLDPSDPSSPGAVDDGLNTIDLGYEHHLQTGDAIAYNNRGGENIPGLTNGRTYYVIVVNPTTIKLATTLDKALANDADVDITSGLTDDLVHSFRKTDNLVLDSGKSISLGSSNLSVLANIAVSGQGADAAAVGGSVTVNTAVSDTQSHITDATAHALIGGGRIHVSIAEHQLSLRQGGANDLPDHLRPCSEHQEELGQGLHLVMVGIENHGANPLSRRGAPRAASVHDDIERFSASASVV